MGKFRTVVERLDNFFRVRELGPDASFSRFIPMVYDPIGFDWKNYFEPEFTELFNGLMLKSAEDVSTVFCSIFPSEEVLDRFIAESLEGDLFFTHHPLDMECGNPRGKLGRGFLPIAREHLDQMKLKKLSFYSCHLPMDIHREVSTTIAMAKALDARVDEGFYSDSRGYVGAICSIEPMSTEELISKKQTSIAATRYGAFKEIVALNRETS